MRLDLVAAWALSVSFATSAVVAGAPSDVAGTRHSSVLASLSHSLDLEHTHPASTAEHANAPEESRVDFAVPLQGTEYIVSAVVSASDSPSSSCGNVHLSFPSKIDGATSWSGSPEPITVEAWDSQQHGRHTLSVSLAAYCPQSRSTSSSVDAVKAVVLSIDDTDFNGDLPNFFITYDHLTHRVDVQSGSYFAAEEGEGSGTFIEYGSLRIPPLDSTDWGKLQGLRDDDADADQPLYALDPSLTQAEHIHLIESAILREESEIDRLTNSLRRHRKLLNNITNGDYAATRGSFKDCHNWSCVLRSFYKKSKACVHNIYIRIVTFVKPASHQEQDCSRMASVSPANQVQFLSSSSKSLKSCSPMRPNTKDYKPITSTIKEVDSESDSDIDDTSSANSSTLSVADEKHSNTTRSAFDRTSSSSHEPFSTTHHIHAILASVLGLLCLSCLATHLHRRCCDPRLRADRAFRREERQARRELRRSAKRQAWKEWWARRLGLGCCMCCGRKDKRVVDYEEKRRLFAPQEQRMEEMMQEEIRFLTSGEAEEGRAYSYHGARVPTPAVARRSMYEASESRRSQRTGATRQSRANTGASQGSNQESLPSYRSRDSSGSRGRPPSYRTRASSLGQRPQSTDPELISVDPVLAARLASVFPQIGRGHRDAEWVSRNGDETPDSSVVDVSPRLSSETLRTERSTV